MFDSFGKSYNIPCKGVARIGFPHDKKSKIFTGETQTKKLIEPIAFGLKAVLVMAMYEVEGSDFDAIAIKMGEIEKVQSSEVAKMDLALG